MEQRPRLSGGELGLRYTGRGGDRTAVSHQVRAPPERGPWGVEGGTAPRQPLPGTREAWPQRVSWLSHLRVAQASPADALRNACPGTRPEQRPPSRRGQAPPPLGRQPHGRGGRRGTRHSLAMAAPFAAPPLAALPVPLGDRRATLGPWVGDRALRLPTGRKCGKRQDDRANMRQRLMRARSEDTPSAPRTETVPVLFGQAARFSRGMKRPDGRHWAGPPHSPLLSVTSSRNPFAVIARSLLADQLIPDGALVLLAILASLHRGNGHMCAILEGR